MRQSERAVGVTGERRAIKCERYTARDKGGRACRSKGYCVPVNAVRRICPCHQSLLRPSVPRRQIVHVPPTVPLVLSIQPLKGRYAAGLAGCKNNRFRGFTGVRLIARMSFKAGERMSMTVREALLKIDATAKAAPASRALLERSAAIKRYKKRDHIFLTVTRRWRFLPSLTER